MLTPRELNQIRDYLLMYGKKDSDLNRIADNPVALTDYVATLREDLNIKATIQDLTDFILDYLGLHGVVDPENPDEHLVLSHNDFTDEYKDKIDGSESGAQENKIEHITITKEGTTSELPIDDKTVNVSFDDYVPKTYTWSGTSASNKLLNEQEINNRINEAEATFLGQCGPYDTTSATDWVTFCGDLDNYISGGGDKNDYIFCTEVYTEDRLPDEDSRYIYHRWKYANPGATTNTQWSAYKGWVYEYDVIPYYLVTDEYPQANSRNAVESQGILAVTGNVPYTESGGVRTYTTLQEQINNIVGGGATTTFISNKAAFLIGTTASFTLTASCSIVADSIKIMQGSTELASVTNNTVATKSISFTESSPTSISYTAKYTVAGVTKPDKTVTISIVKPFYYGAGSTYNSGSLTQDNTARTSVNAQYSITTVLDDYLFFEIPDNLTLHHVYLVSTYDTELGFTQITSSRSGYKAYKTNEKRGAGTYTYKIS